jgi:uncharacterized protein with beta-barrel porin domain
LVVGAGFDWKLAVNAAVGIFYSGALGDRDADNSLKGRLGLAF